MAFGSASHSQPPRPALASAPPVQIAKSGAGAVAAGLYNNPWPAVIGRVDGAPEGSSGVKVPAVDAPVDEIRVSRACLCICVCVFLCLCEWVGGWGSGGLHWCQGACC